MGVPLSTSSGSIDHAHFETDSETRAMALHAKGGARRTLHSQSLRLGTIQVSEDQP